MRTRVCIAFPILVIGLTAWLAQPAPADCPFAHTHIGKNPTWRPDWSDPGNPNGATDPNPDDDSQLWMFSIPPVHPVAPTPGWPEWGNPSEEPFLWLVPEYDPQGNLIPKPGDPDKYLHVCRFWWSEEHGYTDPEHGMQHLDGWHSAHGPQGAWNLASTGDPTLPPDWDIRLRREGASVAEDDFFMLLPDGTPVLDTNGSTYQLERMWLEDKNAWGLHEHMGFHFWLSDVQGQEVSATFTAFDAGGMYDPSEPFELRFVSVPEPAAAVLLLAGLLAAARRR